MLDINEIYSNVRMKENVLYDGIELNLKYSLAQDTSYQITPKDQNIVFELVDEGPAKATYSKEYKLTGEEAEKLAIGEEIRLPIFFQDDKMMTKINSFQKFKLNIYTSFGSHKMLLATREVKWFFMDKLNNE